MIRLKTSPRVSPEVSPGVSSEILKEISSKILLTVPFYEYKLLKNAIPAEFLFKKNSRFFEKIL